MKIWTRILRKYELRQVKRMRRQAEFLWRHGMEYAASQIAREALRIERRWER